MRICMKKSVVHHLFNVVIDKFAADLLKVISLFLQPLLIVYRTSIDVFHNKYMDSRILLI